jgi:hypothetical protein
MQLKNLLAKANSGSVLRQQLMHLTPFYLFQTTPRKRVRISVMVLI